MLRSRPGARKSGRGDSVYTAVESKQAASSRPNEQRGWRHDARKTSGQAKGVDAQNHRYGHIPDSGNRSMDIRPADFRWLIELRFPDMPHNRANHRIRRMDAVGRWRHDPRPREDSSRTTRRQGRKRPQHRAGRG